jgi:transcription initiation factor TFIIIB Brf1 subunit/transcription initiation factor TFIIB
MTRDISAKSLGTLSPKYVTTWYFNKKTRKSGKRLLLRSVRSSLDSNRKNLIYALSEIDRMACALKLPINIREAASMLYRKAIKKRLIRGRSIEGISAAILYVTCRQYRVPRTLEEVRDISRVGQKEAFGWFIRFMEGEEYEGYEFVGVFDSWSLDPPPPVVTDEWVALHEG